MRPMSEREIIITAEDRLMPSSEPTRARPTKSMGARPAKGAKPAKTPKAKPARKASPRLRFMWMTPLQKVVAGGIAATALVVVGFAVWNSGAPRRLTMDAVNSVLGASARAGLKVEEITVSGRSRTVNTQIVQALATRIGDPILGIDLGLAKARLETIPTVRTAAVERRLPGNIHIVINERQPMALWQNDGVFQLIDRDGHQIPGSIKGFEHLPLVVGEGAGPATADLLEFLATEPTLASRVKAAIRVGNRRWDIRLDDVANGLEAKLPEEEPGAAWHRLAELDRSQNVTRRNITMIDLRLPDRLVVKTGNAQTLAAKSKDGGA